MLFYGPWAFLLLLKTARSGNVTLGSNCLISHNQIDPASHAFQSDCDPQTYCSAQGTCMAKQCRRDEWPFGYPPQAILPPLCPSGFYCPDEEDSCKKWIGVGMPCQIDRDDECEPPPSFGNTSSLTATVLPICLKEICFYANVTIGESCVIDKTIYASEMSNNGSLTTTVTRDNCISRTFCDPTLNVCTPSKVIGDSCQEDRECLSENCESSNTCGQSPGMPLKIPAWQYVLTGMAILAGIISTFIILISIHKRDRQARFLKLQEYYREQTSFRSSIITLRSTIGSESVEVNNIKKVS